MSEFIDLYKRGGNEAIKINKPTGADFHITDRGSDWLFTVFCIFTAFAIVYTLLMFRKPINERLFYYTAIAPAGFMAITYFTMASNLGWTPIKAEFNHVKTSTQTEHPGYRQIFYSKYIGWFLSWPWIIVQASLFGDTPLWQIFFNVAFTEMFTVCWLIGSLVKSTYKWGYWVFGIAGAIITCISIMTTTRNLVKARDHGVQTMFLIFMSVVMFLWFVYPVAWGLCEGGNVLQPDSETIFFGALDVLMFAVVPLIFIVASSYLGVDRLGLSLRPLPGSSPAFDGMHSPSMPHMASQTPVASPALKTPSATATPNSEKSTKKKHHKKSKKSKHSS